MMTEQKLWSLQICADMAWDLSLELAMQCAKLGSRGKGISIVCFESQKVAEKLFGIVKKLKFGKPCENPMAEINDLLGELKLLSVNALLELLRINHDESGYEIGRAIAVLVYRLNDLIEDIMAISEEKKNTNVTALKVKKPLASTDTFVDLFRFSVGEVSICENTRYIMEIYFTENIQLDKGIFKLRGLDLPVIDLYSALGSKKPAEEYTALLVVNTDWRKKNCLYAVPIDEISMANYFRSNLGFNTTVSNRNIPEYFVRECWDAEDSEQFIFIDWETVATRHE